METQTFYTTVGSISFTLLGLWWVVVRTLREEHDSPRMARGIESIAIPIYALVAVIALVPELINGLGIGLTALQAEAIILSILLFFGVQAAWILMVEPLRVDTAATPRQPGDAVARRPEGPQT